MYGFEWQEQRGVEGTGFVRALRSRLTSHLPQFQPELDKIIKTCLEEELNKTNSKGEHHTLSYGALYHFTDSCKIIDFVPVKLFPMVKRIVTKVNCFVFFGRELSEFVFSGTVTFYNVDIFSVPGENTDFTKAILEFPQTVVFAAELLRMTPEFLRP